MQSEKGKLELAKEYIPVGEEIAIQEIEKINKTFLPTHDKPSRRGQHAKHHGCVKAEFIVEANLPEEVKFGIFQEPGRSFTACIRFSNASGDAKQPDTKADTRGMAIKLLGVEGEKLLEGEKHEKTQDFVMISHPVFFIRNVSDYVELFKAVQEAQGKSPLKFFFPSLNPFRWRLHEFMIVRAIRSKKPASPLALQYWSTTPYKLGSGAMKFSAKPSSPPTLSKSASSSDNYLREAMVEHLKSKEASFDFLVQLQTDANQMPIEDPTIEWKSPELKVATIKIPPQAFDSDAQMEFCENLSYTPWHSLPTHQPLGGINRARKLVYQSLSKLRHELNHAPQKEPSEEELLKLFGE
jgi:catalase